MSVIPVQEQSGQLRTVLLVMPVRPLLQLKEAPEIEDRLRKMIKEEKLST